MKLYSTVRVDMNENEVLAQSGVVARIRRALRGNPELAADNMRAVLDTAILVEAHVRALRAVGATDAVALVVDDLILFGDRDRHSDDLGELLLAFLDYAPAMDTDFRVVRLTVEHEEAGIHHVIELQARMACLDGEAPVRIIVSGRLAALEPRHGETAHDYCIRVEPLLQDRGAFQIAQASFDNFVTRVRDAIGRAIPQAHASVVPPEDTTRRSGEPGTT